MANGTLFNMDPRTQQMLQRIGWAVLGVVFLVTIVSAIQRKEGSLVTEVVIDIQPLPGGNSLLTEDTVRNAIV